LYKFTILSRSLSKVFKGRFGDIEKIASLFDIPQEQKTEQVHEFDHTHNDCIVFDNVSFHYEKHTPTLTDVHLTIQQDENVLIFGASGAGKSTLLGLMTGLLQPSSGTVYLLGQDITSISLEDIAKEMGVSVQRAAELEKKGLERFKKNVGSMKGFETKESLKAIAVPAAKQFVELLGEKGVEDFVMDVLKMPRATEKDIELLVDLQAMAEEGAEEEAAAELIRLYLQGSNLPVIGRFADALRAKETAGRPSKVTKYF
jgi:ABC-type multidrug transport system fused ATPase/permease subunit